MVAQMQMQVPFRAKGEGDERTNLPRHTLTRFLFSLSSFSFSSSLFCPFLFPSLSFHFALRVGWWCKKQKKNNTTLRWQTRSPCVFYTFIGCWWAHRSGRICSPARTTRAPCSGVRLRWRRTTARRSSPMATGVSERPQPRGGGA